MFVAAFLDQTTNSILEILERIPGTDLVIYIFIVRFKKGVLFFY